MWEEWDHGDSTPHLHKSSDTYDTVDFGYLASTTALVFEVLTPVFLTAEWRRLVMLNFTIDPAVLEPYCPRGTEIDSWQGQTYVSLVGFLFLDTKVGGIAIPFHRDFEEINLRFYVRATVDGEVRRGVVFVREVVPRPAITFVARWLYNENYVTCPTRSVFEHDGLFLVSMTATLVAQTPPELVPKAEELVDRSIAYHDPDGRFLSTPLHLVFRDTRPGKTDRHSKVWIDAAGGRFEMEWRTEHVLAGTIDGEHCEMTLDGRREISEEESESLGELSCERLERMRNYYTYLWGLPMKLRDPGTRLGRVAAESFEGRPVYSLRVTYDAEVGGDTWYFYFDRGNAELVGYRFYHDESKNDGEVIVLEGELAELGLRLPRSRTWSRHEDGALLGTDHLERLETW